MVGVTGIEPVTPTMSTSRPYGTCRGLRGVGATPQSICVHAFDKRSAFQVRQTSGHYVADNPFLPGYVPRPISLGEGISWTPSIRAARAMAMRRSRPLPLVRLAGEVGRP